jgi:hypothetical protein
MRLRGKREIKACANCRKTYLRYRYAAREEEAHTAMKFVSQVFEEGHHKGTESKSHSLHAQRAGLAGYPHRSLDDGLSTKFDIIYLPCLAFAADR